MLSVPLVGDFVYTCHWLAVRGAFRDHACRGNHGGSCKLMVIYLRLRVKFLGVFFKSFAKRSPAVVNYAITGEGRLNSLRLLWVYILTDGLAFSMQGKCLVIS